MNNHVYIIASLPVLKRDVRSTSELDFESIVGEIVDQCEDKEKELISLLLEDSSEMEELRSHYLKARDCKNGFIREFFHLDLAVKNEKVNFLNRKLGRPAGTDTLFIENYGFDEEALKEISAAYENADLLEREKGIDVLVWDRIDEMTMMNHLDFTAILAFLCKLRIINRWLKLDPDTGREFFRELVSEVRGSFKGFENN